MAKCFICKQGELHAGQVTVTLQRGEATLIFKNVPAQVCENCGEYNLSDAVTEKVMALAEASVEKGAEVEILRYAA